ncbi:hypothetical protein IOQ59_20725 [Pontibacterium sp. N1Y112]|uniref:DUF4760 domain-containing protein n=1 Tax=Pontibacterium sinense TaxID=2781979 RepID=A0A8J7FIL6_9GAMM|nr:hypothetical protein [Pontibacterium sinense]MBE9399696.1 hypothetical protein [Pontibacterium sinense]
MEIDRGLATLIAAIVAAIFALITTVMSGRSSRKNLSLEHSLSSSKDIEGEKRNRINEQLSEFYNPLVTLLSVNRDIFQRIGPTSETRRSGRFNDEETAEVWRNLCKTVVVPNNIRVCEIIEKNIHLIKDHSQEKQYFDFLTHAYAYQVFQETTYEAYALFTFPDGFLESVVIQRDELVESFNKTYGINKKRWYQWPFFTR